MDEVAPRAIKHPHVSNYFTFENGRYVPRLTPQSPTTTPTTTVAAEEGMEKKDGKVAVLAAAASASKEAKK